MWEEYSFLYIYIRTHKAAGTHYEMIENKKRIKKKSKKINSAEERLINDG